MMRKGIHPVISEVILVGITIAIAITAVSWMLGVWHSEQESFSITPILYVRSNAGSNGNAPVLYLHLSNSGGKEVNIIKIEVSSGNGSWVNTTEITVPPGTRFDYTISQWIWQGTGDPPELFPGMKLRVIVYTERFGSYFVDVIVKSE